MIISVTFVITRPLYEDDVKRFSEYGVLYFSQLRGVYTFTVEGNGPYLLEEAAKAAHLIEVLLNMGSDLNSTLEPKINSVYATHDSLMRSQ
jgi:hypothetical protein